MRHQRFGMPKGSDTFGTRCEMKMSTPSAVRRAVEYEAKRQIEILEAGGEIHQKPAAGTT